MGGEGVAEEMAWSPPHRWRRSGPRACGSHPDAVLEVTYGVLDLDVAAMIGREFSVSPSGPKSMNQGTDARLPDGSGANSR